MTDSTPRPQSPALTRALAKSDAVCHACGYNLRGMRSVFCPECGTVIPAPVGGAPHRVVLLRGPTVWWLSANSITGALVAAAHLVRGINAVPGAGSPGAHWRAAVGACLPLVFQLAFLLARRVSDVHERPLRRIALWCAIVGTIIVVGTVLDL